MQELGGGFRRERQRRRSLLPQWLGMLTTNMANKSSNLTYYVTRPSVCTSLTFSRTRTRSYLCYSCRCNAVRHLRGFADNHEFLLQRKCYGGTEDETAGVHTGDCIE